MLILKKYKGENIIKLTRKTLVSIFTLVLTAVALTAATFAWFVLRNDVDGLDYMVARKVIRKFETLNLPFLQQELEELVTLIDKIFGKTNFTEVKAMIKDYQKQM